MYSPIYPILAMSKCFKIEMASSSNPEIHGLSFRQNIVAIYLPNPFLQVPPLGSLAMVHMGEAQLDGILSEQEPSLSCHTMMIRNG